MHGLLVRPSEQAGLPAVPLAAGTDLALIPLDDKLDGTAVPGFYELTDEVAAWARSLPGTVAYLHSEFFGGSGFQAAVAWRGGEVVWGPSFTATAAEPGHVVTGPDDLAVNACLRWLGVRRDGHLDEFDTVGLDRHSR